MKSFFLSALLIFFANQLPAQNAASEPEAAQVVAVESAPSDAAIAERLREILGALEHEGIAVDVKAGVVTLSGVSPILR